MLYLFCGPSDSENVVHHIFLADSHPVLLCVVFTYVSNRGSSKVWICIFTCLVTRAVHLDIVPDLRTETFVQCLKQFAAMRSLAHKFWGKRSRSPQDSLVLSSRIRPSRSILPLKGANGYSTLNVSHGGGVLSNAWSNRPSAVYKR